MSSDNKPSLDTEKDGEDIEKIMRIADEKFEAYIKLENCRNLDITTLNPKRQSASTTTGAPTCIQIGVKIASLDCKLLFVLH